MGESNVAAILLGIVAIVAVIGVVMSGSGVTGFAVTDSDKAKTDNTPCARDCTMICTPNAALPAPEAEELSIHDCVLQCMNARCGQTARAGKCDAFSADGCCNVFALDDPDCEPTACKVYPDCAVSSLNECCNGAVSDPSCGGIEIRCLP